MQQMNLLSSEEMRPKLSEIKARSFGGVSLKKRRKVKRPLLPGKVHHVVFKSTKAKGKMSFYAHKLTVRKLLDMKAKKFFVQIQDFVNMGNHLHLKVKFKDPKRFQQFLKSFSSLLAREITGAKKGNPFGKFWDGLVFTRILMSRFEELGLKGYFTGNYIQKEVAYRSREEYLSKWNRFLYRLKQRRASKAAKKELSLLISHVVGKTGNGTVEI
jgi:REP element-mobilizing transposase RayT